MAKQHGVDTNEVRTWEAYDGDLPRPLNVLVYRRRAPGGPFHAHCIQYSGVYARGATQEAAIEEVLRLLLHHLYECQISRTRPMRSALQIYQDAFYMRGEPVQLTDELRGLLPVRIRVRKHRSAQAQDVIDIRTTHDKVVVGGGGGGAAD